MERTGAESSVRPMVARLMGPGAEAGDVVEVDDVGLEAYREEAADTPGAGGAGARRPAASVGRGFVAASPPAEPAGLVLGHQDLGAEHLLAGPDRVT